jgi:hypothetical protein
MPSTLNHQPASQTYDEFPERRQIPLPDLQFRRNALQQLETKSV